MTAILKGDGVARPSFKQVVLNTDAYDALAKNRIQYTAVFGGIDDVTARLQGVKLRVFPYRRYLGAAGDYPNAVFVASDGTIASARTRCAATLAALAQGYEYSAKHPAEAEKILIATNRTALGKSAQIVSGDGQRDGSDVRRRGRALGAAVGGRLRGAREDPRGGGLVKGQRRRPRPVHERALPRG